MRIHDGEQPSTSQQPDHQGRYFNLRIPIRWRWTVLVGFAITITIVVLYFIILDIERHAWLQNQAAQAELQVDRLTDELKLPLLSGSSTETDIVIQGFLEKVPTVLGVLIEYPDGQSKSHGSIDTLNMLPPLPNNKTVTRLPVKTLWYVKTVIYANTTMGTIAVRFSEQKWEDLAGQLGQKIFTAAVIVVLCSGLLIFWIAGRMSKPIEMLADAAHKVAAGDYHIQLPVHGRDELADALTQFNAMVRELAHKEELRDVFGRYLNPKLVSDVFAGGDVNMQNHRQEVTVLFADMVRFTPFSESTAPEEVVTVLNRHFEVFHRIIAYYGGHVDKYIGDAIMAVFNHPVPDDNHSQHAAKAGLAIAIACQRLGIIRPDGEAISFRVGLNVGPAIVGNIGAAKRLEYTVIGDAVNVASRMGGLGAGGELIMPRDSFARLGQDFAFKTIDSGNIKGISQELEVGQVSVCNLKAQQHIEHVVDLAFNFDLPLDERQITREG